MLSTTVLKYIITIYQRSRSVTQFKIYPKFVIDVNTTSRGVPNTVWSSMFLGDLRMYENMAFK